MNPELTTCWDRWGILHKDPSWRPKWHSFRNTSMYLHLPAGKRSGKPVPPQSCTDLQSRKYSWFLHFYFIPTFLRNKVSNISGEKKKKKKKRNFYNGTPGTRTIVLPSFWCDLCSLKSHLEYPSAIKRERSFFWGKASLRAWYTEKSNHKFHGSWLHGENCVLQNCYLRSVKIQSEGMRLKNKRLLGRSLRNQKQCHSRKKETSPGSWLPQGCGGCTLGTVEWLWERLDVHGVEVWPLRHEGNLLKFLGIKSKKTKQCKNSRRQSSLDWSVQSNFITQKRKILNTREP